MTTIYWQNLSPTKKAQLAQTRPILIMGSRELSPARIQQLTASLLAKRSLIWGCLAEPYIAGLENSPLFRSLSLAALETGLSSSTQAQASQLKILVYEQRYAKYLLKELNPAAVIFINGSWAKIFHTTELFYTLIKEKLNYKLVSPFINETEAKEYEQILQPEIDQLVQINPQKKYSDVELMIMVHQLAKKSYDYSFQIGALAAKDGRVLATGYNRVVPYQTYALHYGNSREKNFSPPHDLNYYDTNHDATELLLDAQHNQVSLTGATFYSNVMPCPFCTRMLCRTGIKKLIYKLDHSDGYALQIFSQAGIDVERWGE